MESNINSGIVKTSIMLEEYIPLKVVLDRKEESVKNLSYSKDKTSLLEISIGVASGLIKRITLLLSKEYDISNSKLSIDFFEKEDLKINDESKNICAYFKTHLYADGIRIAISEEKVLKYVQMDKLYIGISSSDRIAEICLCQLNPDEIKHIRNELDYQ